LQPGSPPTNSRDFSVAYRKDCWANEHLGSHDTQALGFRAYRALEQYLYGLRDRPRFKRRALRGLGGRKPSDRAVRQSKARSAQGNSGDVVGRKPESPGKTLVPTNGVLLVSSPAGIPFL